MKNFIVKTVEALKALDLSTIFVDEDINIEIKLRLENETIDFPININHTLPGFKSNVYVKLALYGSSKVKMPVEIIVQSGAINTSTAFKALVYIMSDESNANVTPGLLIHEKDILSASHGVVIKNVKDIDLFYLRARGIEKELAKEMIVNL